MKVICENVKGAAGLEINDLLSAILTLLKDHDIKLEALKAPVK